MKPRSAFEKRVVATNGSLRTIGEKHFVEVYNRACEHVAFQNKEHTLICGDCGEVIENIKPDKNGLVKCPHCGKKLKPMDNRKWSYRQTYYVMAIDYSKGFQVLRYYLLSTYFRKRKPVYLSPMEVFRVFINENGKRAVCAKLRAFMTYRDEWRYGSDIELRPVNNKHWEYTPYDIRAYANVRARRLSPKAKLVGIDVNDLDFPSVETICKIFKDNRFETIWKAGMHELAYRLSEKEMDAMWPALKICMRNHYMPSHVSDYIDYIRQLIQLGKDIRNAHYACPDNLEEAHAKTNNAIRKIMEKKRYEQEKERIAQAEEEYAKWVLPFLALDVKSRKFNITVLPNVKAFFEEGQAMHHCVYSNRYYEKENTLILSCRDKQDNRLATIEIGLPKCEIRQIRAKCNHVPAQYDSIVRVLTRQRKQIQQLSQKLSKKGV